MYVLAGLVYLLKCRSFAHDTSSRSAKKGEARRKKSNKEPCDEEKENIVAKQQWQQRNAHFAHRHMYTYVYILVHTGAHTPTLCVTHPGHNSREHNPSIFT